MERLIRTVIACALLSLCANVFASPQRIVSLAPSITKSLYLLGVEDRLIANTTYCTQPPQARDKEKIGGVMEVNLEKIISLQPDLIMVIPLTNTQVLDKLRSLGIKIVTFPAAENFGQLCNQFLKMGEIVGKEKEAKKIVYQARKKVSFIKQKAKGLPKPKVLVQVGNRPLWVAPKRSFVNDFIEVAGGINIGPPGKNGLYSIEKVLVDNPDVIIITTMGMIGEEETKMWERFKTLNAVKNNKIYIIDSYKICSPTPVEFGETLEEIFCLLHSEGR
ncbi:TPA: ABC transporter substrate-binding protein [bacterium]|nr:ABC transporter substrate-binding protein [bacterium]